MRLEILSQLISLLYIHPDVCLMVMAVIGVRIVSMAELSTMMPLLDLSGLRIKYPLVQTKQY